MGQGPQPLRIPSGLDWQPRFSCNRVQSGLVAGLLLVAQLDFDSLIEGAWSVWTSADQSSTDDLDNNDDIVNNQDLPALESYDEGDISEII